MSNATSASHWWRMTSLAAFGQLLSVPRVRVGLPSRYEYDWHNLEHYRPSGMLISRVAARDVAMSPNEKKMTESVFVGESDMAARMRAFDWSKTDLGPVERWSQSLRAGVRIILGSGHPMLISWGPNHTMLYNDAYGVVVGSSKHPAALGQSCREVLAEAWDYIGPRFDAVYQEGRAIGTVSHQMFTFRRKDYLEECYFAFSYSPVPDDNGDVGGVLTNALDLTDRVVEDRRKQVVRDLASRLGQARNEEDIWRISSDTLSQNPTSAPFALLYEYQPSKGEARLAAVSLILNEEMHPQIIHCDTDRLWNFSRSLMEDCLLVSLERYELGLLIPGWPTPPREATVLPIRLSERGEATGFLVLALHPGRAFDEDYRHFVHRIAEQIAIGLATARAYEEERRRAEALAELDRAKTAFFSNVSHEFRTPLALILGPLEEMLSDAGDQLSPERHEQLVTVRRNAVRLLKLVNTLLDFSRIEAGRVQAVYEPTDLAAFTTDIASLFRSAMEKAGLRYSVECHSISEMVYIDRDMWEKIVSNLLSNAFKFTFEGIVSLTLKAANDAVELRVRDTGIGIPQDQRERVFERFHRIEGTQGRTHEGTGIGLALVQELVRLHGGSVQLESVLGQGSAFTVRVPFGHAHLPAERIQAGSSLASTAVGAATYAEEAVRWLPDELASAVDATLHPNPALNTSLPHPVSAPKRDFIVVADDNADMRQYFKRLLGDRYDVQAVADGRLALAATQTLRPALVLADVMMPHMDGFGLLRAVRDDPTISSTPVILVSARAGEESRVEGMHAGADDYLVKPFTSRELLARVEAHLSLATHRRESAEREERLRGDIELKQQQLRASEERLAQFDRFNRELNSREAKIRRLFDANIVGVAIWDLDGRILDANDAYLQMVGYERGDILAGRMSWRDLTPTEWLEREERIWIPQLKFKGSLAPFEKEYFRKDGSRVPILIGLAMIEDGGSQGVAFALDLTERKRAADELRELQAQLAHANRLATMGQLAASIAHEVNQPIGAARNNAHAALRFLAGAPPDLVEVGEALECVVNDTYRAGDIISRIRDQVKKTPPSMIGVDVNDAIEQVVGLVRAELEKNSVSLQLQLCKGLALAHGDRVQLQQVILNLMLNAIEAMANIDNEQRELAVRTEFHSPNGLSVTVTDSGPGIALADQERVFESFYTTKVDGVGIGLSICRSIIDAHGGRLWAEDHQPRGAVFTFTLPAHS